VDNVNVGGTPSYIPVTGSISLPLKYNTSRSIPSNEYLDDSTFFVFLEGLSAEGTSDFSAHFHGSSTMYWYDVAGPYDEHTDYDSASVIVGRADLALVDGGDQLASDVQPDYWESRIPTDIVSNTRDDDFDGISDVFDGFNIDETDSIDDKSIPIREGTGFLTPITFKLPGGLNDDWATISFNYDASDPDESTISDQTRKNADEGALRLWNKDKTEARDKLGISEGGDFVEPQEPYLIADVELQTIDGDRYAILYLEGIRTGEYFISASVDPFANYDFPNQTGPYEVSFPSYSDKVAIRVLEEVAVYASDQIGEEPGDNTTESDEDTIKFVFSRGDGNTLGERDVYYRVVFNQEGIDEERQLRRPTSSLIVGEGSDYTVSTGEALALEDVRWFGKTTIEDGQHFSTIEIKARNEQEAYFLSEWDEFITIEMLTYAEYRASFDEIEPRGIDLPPDAPQDGEDEGSTTLNPGSGPQPHFYSPPLYALFDGSDDDPENPFINNGVIGTAMIIDRDDVFRTDIRNLDIESTGLDASNIVKGPVSVDLRDGAVELQIPLGGLVYRENDNLVPVAQIEFAVPWDGETVTGIAATMTFAGIVGEKVEFDLSRLQEYYEFALRQNTGNQAEDFNPHRTIRLIVFASNELASQIPSGHYDYDVVFETHLDGFFEYKTVRGSTEFINRTGTDFGANEFGQRWTLEEISRLTFNDEQTLGGNAFIPESGQGENETTRTSAASRLTTIGATSETSIALLRGDNTSANYPAVPDTDSAELLLFSSYSELEVPEAWVPGTAGSSSSSGGPGGTGGSADPDFLIAGPGEEDDSGARAEHYLEWEIAGAVVGKPIQIFTTWTEGPNRASNVPYTIYGAAPAGGGAWAKNENNGQGGTYNKTVYVDQRFVAGQLLDVDHEDAGRNWRSLGFFVPYEQEDGSVSVRVRISTKLPLLPGETGDRQDVNGKVVAQAIMAVAAWDTESNVPIGTVSDLIQEEYTDYGEYNYSHFGIETKHGDVYEFDGHGLQISAEDRLGNRTHYHYIDADGDALRDEIGRIETQGNSVAKVFEYDDDGKIDRIYFTNSHRDLVQGEDATEFGDQWFAFTGDRLTGVTLESGVVGSANINWNFDYRSDFPLLTGVLDGAGNETTLNRDANGAADIGRIHGINADNGEWYLVSDLRSEYDLLLDGDIPLPRTGLIESVFDNDSFVEPRAHYQSEYHTNNFETIWRFQTDAWGMQTVEVRPSTNNIDNTLNKWIWERDEWGLPVRFVEPSYRGTKFGTVDDPNGNGNRPYEQWLHSLTTEFEYDDNKFLTKATYASGTEEELIETWNYSDQNTASGRSAYLLQSHQPPAVEDQINYGFDGNSNISSIQENGRTTFLSEFTSTPTDIDSIPAGLARKSQIAGDAQVNRVSYHGDGTDDGRLLRGQVSLETTSTEYPGPNDIGRAISYDYDGSLQRTATYVFEGTDADFGDPSLHVPTYYKFDWLGQLVYEESAFQQYFNPGNVQFDSNGIPSNPINAAQGSRVDYYYDAAGNLFEINEHKGSQNGASSYLAVTRNYYDDLNRLRYTQSPGGLIGDMEYFFDVAGNLRFEIEHLENGTTRTIEHQYDQLNQRIKTLHDAPQFEAGLNVPLDSRVRPIVHYVYDANGNLYWQTDARYGLDDGQQGYLPHTGTTFFYDSLGRLVAERQEVEQGTGHRAPVTRYKYDDGGRVTQTLVQTGVGGDSFTSTISTYDSLGRLESITEPPNESGIARETTYSYDLRDNVVLSVVNGGGLTTIQQSRFDVLDRIIGVSGNELKTIYAYDKFGFVAVEKTTAGSLSNSDFGITGAPTVTEVVNSARQEAASAGNQKVLLTRYTNDRLGNTIAMVSPDLYVEGTVNDALSETDGSVLSIYERDLSGNLTSTLTRFRDKDVNGTRQIVSLWESQTYDLLNRPVTSKSLGGDADGQVETAITYWLDGNVSSTQTREADGSWTSQNYTYDSLGRLYRTSFPSLGISTLQFADAIGNVVFSRDANGGENSYTYDFLGRLKSSTERIGQDAIGSTESGTPATTEYSYDSEGRVRREIRPDGDRSTYVYDRAGNVVRESHGERVDSGDFEERVTLYRDFDINGNSLELVNPGGAATQFVYDYAGRLIFEKVADQAAAKTWQYDAFGSLETHVNRRGGGFSNTNYNTGLPKTTVWNDAGNPERVETLTYTSIGEIESATVTVGGELDSSYVYDYDESSRSLRSLGRSIAGLESDVVSVYETDVVSRERDTDFFVGGQLQFESTHAYDQLYRLQSLTLDAQQATDDNPRETSAALSYVGNRLQRTDYFSDSSFDGGVVNGFYSDGRIASTRYLHGGTENLVGFDYDSLGRFHSRTENGDQDFINSSEYERPDTIANDVPAYGRGITNSENSEAISYDSDGNLTQLHTYERIQQSEVVNSEVVDEIQAFEILDGSREYPAGVYEIDLGDTQLSEGDYIFDVFVAGSDDSLGQGGLTDLSSISIGFTMDSSQPVNTPIYLRLQVYNEGEYVDIGTWIPLENIEVVHLQKQQNFDWDAANRLKTLVTSEFDADGNLQETTTSYRYDIFSGLIGSRTETGSPASALPAGQLSVVQDGEISETTYIQDKNGNRFAAFSKDGSDSPKLSGFTGNTDSGQTLLIREVFNDGGSVTVPGESKHVFHNHQGIGHYLAGNSGFDKIEHSDGGVPQLGESNNQFEQLVRSFPEYDLDFESGVFLSNGRAFSPDTGMFLSESQSAVHSGATNTYQSTAVAPTGEFNVAAEGPNFNSDGSWTGNFKLGLQVFGASLRAKAQTALYVHRTEQRRLQKVANRHSPYTGEAVRYFRGSAENMYNIGTFGLTDYVGVTDSSEFTGWGWTGQKVGFTVARESFISAGTLGSGSAISAGSTSNTVRLAWAGGTTYEIHGVYQSGSAAYDDFANERYGSGAFNSGLTLIGATGLSSSFRAAGKLDPNWGSATNVPSSMLDRRGAVRIRLDAPKLLGEIPWSNPQVRASARQLREGLAHSTGNVEIVVRNRGQAEELFLRMFQGDGFRNTTGWSGDMLSRWGRKGIYHWDETIEVLEDGSRVLKRHYNDGNLHNYVPHLQIETFDNRVIRVLFGKDIRITP
jgi:YD repeat-containing protein